MKVQTKQLKPGMTLLADALGKSSKPLIKKRTVLTELHIEFLDKFLVPDVQIAPFPGNIQNEKEKQQSDFAYEYEQIVKYYKAAFTKLQQNIPLNNLFDIRKTFIPFFETVQEQPFNNFLYLLDNRPKADMLFYKSVAMGMLAVYIAKRINYEKKDWLQIGFAALLADAGFARMSQTTKSEKESENPSEAFRMHPFHSYKIVEDITTLKKTSKIAILQHQEKLDGSGYPAKIRDSKILPYARIITVCDEFYRLNDFNLSQNIHLLNEKKGVTLDKQVTGFLIGELKAVQSKK